MIDHNENENEIPDPSPDDLDDLQETAMGHPLRQPAAEALARCRRQLALLRVDLAELPPNSHLVPDIRREIQDLQQRITEYEHQLKPGNTN